MKIHQSINMKKSYSCAICKKLFIDPANLVKHVEFIHEPDLSPIKSSAGSLAKKEKDPINNENDPDQGPPIGPRERA